MAITVNDLTVSGNRFALNAYSTDLSGGEELKAAPSTTGQALYIDRISIVFATASTITVTIGEGETGDGVTTVLIGPVPFSIVGTQAVFEFKAPLKLTDNTSLSCDSSGAGAANIVAEGFTQ